MSELVPWGCYAQTYWHAWSEGLLASCLVLWMLLAMQVVDFLAECLSVGLMSVDTIVKILSTERLRAFEHCSFHALLPLMMMRVMDLASQRTSVLAGVRMLKGQMLQTGKTWVGRQHLARN